MIDALIRNGDVATDGTGSIVRAEGADALFQRALLCLTVPKGSFLYDRELGVRSGGADLQRTELLFAESQYRRRRPHGGGASLWRRMKQYTRE